MLKFTLILLLISPSSFAKCADYLLQIEAILSEYSDQLEGPAKVLKEYIMHKEAEDKITKKHVKKYKKQLKSIFPIMKFEFFETDQIKELQRKAQLYCSLEEYEMLKKKVKDSFNYYRDGIFSMNKELSEMK